MLPRAQLDDTSASLTTQANNGDTNAIYALAHLYAQHNSQAKSGFTFFDNALEIKCAISLYLTLLVHLKNPAETASVSADKIAAMMLEAKEFIREYANKPGKHLLLAAWAHSFIEKKLQQTKVADIANNKTIRFIMNHALINDNKDIPKSFAKAITHALNISNGHLQAIKKGTLHAPSQKIPTPLFKKKNIPLDAKILGNKTLEKESDSKLLSKTSITTTPAYKVSLATNFKP